MKITDVNLKILNNDSTIKAMASMTIDDCFVIHNLKVLDVDGNIFVAMPSKKLADGTFKDVAHPINKETRTTVENAVLGKYRELLDETKNAEIILS